MRGVPRARAAISRAPASSIGNCRIPAVRRTGHAHDQQCHPLLAVEQPAPAAVRRRFTAEGGGQAGTARLQEDRRSDGDGDEQLGDLEKITLNAMKSAFIHHDERIKIIYDVLKPRYARIREQIAPFA